MATKVKVDGYIEIPKHEWYHILDHLTRVDEELEVLIKQINYTNELLEKILKLLTALSTVAALPTPTAVAEQPVALGKIVALPYRVRPMNTAKYTVDDTKAYEVLLMGDAFIMTADSDVFISESAKEQNFLLTAGVYLVMYRPPELDKLYAKAATGTANIYLMYLQVES